MRQAVLVSPKTIEFREVEAPRQKTYKPTKFLSMSSVSVSVVVRFTLTTANTPRLSTQ